MNSHEGESFALGLCLGVCIALAVMWFPLQEKADNANDRLIKIEKRIFKNEIH